MLQVCFGVQDCLCSEHLLVAFPNLFVCTFVQGTFFVLNTLIYHNKTGNLRLYADFNLTLDY